MTSLWICYISDFLIQMYSHDINLGYCCINQDIPVSVLRNIKDIIKKQNKAFECEHL